MTLSASPLLPGFVLFCRIGGCLMTAPGFSSERVPVRTRLYLALAITVALFPPLFEQLQIVTRDPGSTDFLCVAVAELIVGAALGLLSRLYFFALEMLATSVAMTVGLGNIFGAAIAESEPTPALSTFVVTTAVTLLFVSDAHLELIRGLYLSYEIAPISRHVGPTEMLAEIARVLTESHLLALQICSPFLLFGLVVNLALGLLARLAPQVQVYFISGPLSIFLGLYAFSTLASDFFSAFSWRFGFWLSRG